MERHDKFGLTMANQFLSLSLFLMLLSFFIVMNSISDRSEVREKPVMNSLALAFSNKTLETDQAPEEDPVLLGTINQGDTLEDLEGLFNAHIAGFEVTKNKFGTVMHVRTPVVAFENAIDIKGYNPAATELGGQGAFLDTLITLLRSEDRAKSYRIDMILNTSDDPVAYMQNSPKAYEDDLMKVTGYARKLEGQGLPTRMMSAGLVEGQEGFIDIYFHEYIPFGFSVDEDYQEGRDGR